MTAADKYYLKARDCFPYEIEESLVALEYGLSVDETHAPLLTLQGEIYYKALSRFDAAAECLSWAIYYDPGYVDAWYHFIELQLIIGDLKKAEDLIARAMAVPGINKGRIWHAEALLLEKQQQYVLALARVKDAINWTTLDEETELYGKEKAHQKEAETDKAQRRKGSGTAASACSNCGGR